MLHKRCDEVKKGALMARVPFETLLDGLIERLDQGEQLTRQYLCWLARRLSDDEVAELLYVLIVDFDVSAQAIACELRRRNIPATVAALRHRSAIRPLSTEEKLRRMRKTVELHFVAPVVA